MTHRFDPLTNLALAHGVIDRRAASRVDDAWLAIRWADPTSRVLWVCDGRLPFEEHDGQVALAWRATESAPVGERYLLGLDPAGWAHFAVRIETPPEGEQHGDLRSLAGVLSSLDAELMVQAVAFANWHSTHPRCPRCGEPTEVVKAGAERRCDADGSAHFPRTDPAVIVLVTDPQERALLGRQASWPVGRFSTLAGFVEPGESAEQAVVREVAEESGVVVSEVRYLGSQPWPFPASLMLGFVASSPSVPAVADGDELAEVRWFDRDTYRSGIRAGQVVAPGEISIARRLIERWFGEPLPSGPAEATWR